MFFQKFNEQGFEKVKNAIVSLTTDAAFQKLFSEDKILNDLDSEKFDPVECFRELQATLGMKLKIGEHYFKQLTPFKWSLLWSLENPLVKVKHREATLEEMELFLYIVNYDNVLIEDIIKIVLEANGYLKREKITEEEANIAISFLTSSAFSGLKLFPSSNAKNTNSEDPVFDADWLTSTVSKVHAMTGFDADYITFKLSLCACSFYFVQWSRDKGVKNIERKSRKEILEAQDARSCELIVEELIKRNVIEEKEKEYYLQIMMTNPNK